MAYGTLNIDNLTSSDGGVISPNINSLRNRIINGAMVIDQRNAGASVTATSSNYTLDRWRVTASQTSKFTVQQNAGSVTPPSGYTNYLGVTSSSAYSVVSSDYFTMTQFIEGYNVADLGFGASGASSVTMSFWVRSSLTGTFGGSLSNSAESRAYPFSYTISSANTWEQKSITITGDTSGTWLTTSGRGFEVNFGLGCGSTYSGTAGAWASSWSGQPTGTVSVVGTNGATFYITGVQLEKGSTATSFDYRPYGTELQLCQRYYIKYGGQTVYQRWGAGVCNSTTNVQTMTSFPVPMRTAPTASASTVAIYDPSGAGIAAISAITQDTGNSTTLNVPIDNTTSGMTQFRYVVALTNNSTSGYMQFSAEL
jgi:hypothetical protein